MKPREPRTTNRDLFPDTWVVGTAAAALAKNDEGVLLADPPDTVPELAAEAQPYVVMPSPAAEEPRRSLEEELAELRAENERLRRCIAGSRGNLEAINWHGDESVADREGGFVVDPAFYLGNRAPRRRSRAGTGARSVLIGGALAIAVGIGAGVWLAGQRLANLDGPISERMQTLRADIVGVVGDVGQRAIAWVRPAASNRGDDPTASGASSD